MMQSMRRGGAGFTLVELLVVILIVTLLATLLIAGLWPQQDKAFRAATETLLGSVKTALEQYYNVFHDYPPDGYDMEVNPAGSPTWKDTSGTNLCTGSGIKLGPPGNQRLYMGSGCLVYFLCHPVVNITVRGAEGGSSFATGGDPRNNHYDVVGPFLKIPRQEYLSVWSWDKDFGIRNRLEVRSRA